MAKSLLILFTLMGAFVHADEGGEWFCEQTASKRTASAIWSCGVGQASDEGSAQKKALENAIEQFDVICNGSTDCKGNPRTISPERTSCKQVVERGGSWMGEHRAWVCHRLIVVQMLK
jgi:hypothetical protein